MTPSEKIYSTPINLTPQSQEKVSVFGHVKPKSLTLSEDLNEELRMKIDKDEEDQ